MTMNIRHLVTRSSIAFQTLRKIVATESASLFRRAPETAAAPVRRSQAGASLFGSNGRRKYLNVEERRRFMGAARQRPPSARLFCLVLAWTGARISEALALTPAAIDIDSGVITLETLKRRRRGFLRQVPVPRPVLRELDREFGLHALQRDAALSTTRLWPWSRTTAWRQVKTVMSAAGVYSLAASPKGLRHAFGVTAFAAVPPHIVQRWLGHASLRTTAIYGDVSGREEHALATRMWRSW